MNRFTKPCGRHFSLLNAVMCFCCLVSLSGCVKDIDQEVSEDMVQVTLRLDQAFQDKAYVRLYHDGSQEDYWFYLVTEDFGTEAAVLLKDEIARSLEETGEIVGNVGTNKNITLESLAAKTEYRVIAARILADGTVTGNVAELTFKTLRNPDVFEVHPSWNIQYKERRALEGDPDAESEVFTCSVGDSKETFVPCLLSKKDFDASYGGNLRLCFEDYVAFRNLDHVKWENVVLDESCEHFEDRLRHGDYILFMIGIDTAGELTGYYAKTDCTIMQETATDAYRRWVGKWTVTGYCGDLKITYSIDISPEENNLYYRMSGWESTSATDYFEALPQERPVLLYFEKSTGDVYVVSEAFDDYFEDLALAEFYDFFLYGVVEVDYGGEMTEVPVDITNIRIAKFTLLGDNLAEVTPETFSFDLNGTHYDAPFLYFNYSYTSSLYAGLVPVTTDSVVPRISTMRLER